MVTNALSTHMQMTNRYMYLQKITFKSNTKTNYKTLDQMKRCTRLLYFTIEQQI